MLGVLSQSGGHIHNHCGIPTDHPRPLLDNCPPHPLGHLDSSTGFVVHRLCHPRDGEVGHLLQPEEKAPKGAENGSGDEDLLRLHWSSLTTSSCTAHHSNVTGSLCTCKVIHIVLVWTDVTIYYSTMSCCAVVVVWISM